MAMSSSVQMKNDNHIKWLCTITARFIIDRLNLFHMILYDQFRKVH